MPRGDEKLERYLERAERAGGRARDLIAQMMTFSRGQRGERQNVNLVALVKEALTLLESSLPASIEMRSDLPATLPTVSIDPVHFEQILVNLCINARDAMNGVGELVVTLGEFHESDLVCSGCREPVEGPFVELAVSDTGPGIDPAILERIFEPFFTTKDIGKGSGMGLSTVHGIVHDHGGHAVVESVVAAGTTMRILLPVSRTVARAESSAAIPRRDVEPGSLSGRVLIVDDNTEVGEYLEDLLGVWGLEVTLSTNPVDAREAIRRDPGAFDLVITDQTMPRLSGLELAKAIAQAAPGLPVFLYTGYSESVTAEIALASGVSAFLNKPLDTAQLRTLVGEILQ
jgi:CheY-like chemotaxis protein